MNARRHQARVVALLLVLTMGAARVARAHPRLLSTRPAAGGTLAAADATELRLTFNEAPEAAPSTVQLTGPDGGIVRLDPLKSAPGDGHSLVTMLPAGLRPGRYTVAWHVAGDDGHMVSGSFTFTISEANATVPPPVITPDSSAVAQPGSGGRVPEEDRGALETPGYVAARWLMYVALMMLTGVTAFRIVVLRMAGRTQALAANLEDEAARRAALLGLIAGLALLLSLAGRLVAQHASLAQGGGPAPAVGDVILRQTTWGHAWLGQLLGALAATALCATLMRGRRLDAGIGAAWFALAAVVAGLSLTPAFSGHAIASGRLTLLAVTADGLHVLAAGAWLGTLLVLLWAGLPIACRSEPESRAAAMARLVTAFSPLALASAATLVVTGFFTAWLHIGTFAALWHSGYGRTLLIKLAVLSGVAATGAFNWKWVQPSLADVGPRGERAAAWLRISGRAELLIGAVVVLVTAILVALPTPHDLP